jgi:hypothetical protein
MFVMFAWLASQAADVHPAVREMKSAIVRTEAVMDQAFTCMEREVKVQAKARIVEGTPDMIVDGALASCAHLKKLYAEAAVTPDAYIAAKDGQELAEGWFSKLREMYVKQVDGWMAKPALADARMTVVIYHWKKCVTEKASDYSRLQDEATTVGQAAVTACNTFRPNLISAIGYQFKSKGLPASRANEVAESLRGDMKEVAVQVVISERAKRLSKP